MAGSARSDADRWLVDKVRAGDIDADEAQDVIIHLRRAVAGFTGSSSFTTWLHRTALPRRSGTAALRMRSPRLCPRLPTVTAASVTSTRPTIPGVRVAPHGEPARSPLARPPTLGAEARGSAGNGSAGSGDEVGGHRPKFDVAMLGDVGVHYGRSLDPIRRAWSQAARRLWRGRLSRIQNRSVCSGGIDGRTTQHQS